MLVVAFERVAGEEVDLFGFWSCDHEQVGVLSAGHVDVGGFSVEAVEADSGPHGAARPARSSLWSAVAGAAVLLAEQALATRAK